MTAHQTVGDRLKFWRKSQNLKGYELAEKIGISPASLSEIESQKSLPSSDTLIKLHSHTNLNIVWLLTSTGVMIKGKGLKEKKFSSKKDKELNDLIERLIRVYDSGDHKKIKPLKAFLMGADPF